MGNVDKGAKGATSWTPLKAPTMEVLTGVSDMLAKHAWIAFELKVTHTCISTMFWPYSEDRKWVPAVTVNLWSQSWGLVMGRAGLVAVSLSVTGTVVFDRGGECFNLWVEVTSCSLCSLCLPPVGTQGGCFSLNAVHIILRTIPEYRGI